MNFNCDGVKLYTIKEFEKLHTKQLLKMRYNMPNPYCEWMCLGCSLENICENNRKINNKTLREVLSNRPHVLNKIESRNKRKALKNKGN